MPWGLVKVRGLCWHQVPKAAHGGTIVLTASQTFSRPSGFCPPKKDVPGVSGKATPRLWVLGENAPRDCAAFPSSRLPCKGRFIWINGSEFQRVVQSAVFELSIRITHVLGRPPNPFGHLNLPSHRGFAGLWVSCQSAGSFWRGIGKRTAQDRPGLVRTGPG